MGSDNIVKKNFSVGVDIETVSRFAGLERKKDAHFLRHVFTEQEMDVCFAKKQPAPHLAGRFAAKEAVYKALTAMGIPGIALRQIEIIKEASGAPRVSVESLAQEPITVALSISHCEDLAIAFVVVVSL
ncbi:MAG: holo-[acyl-carrier-protein] synthase [Candidatus Magasanikbacteria bacterium RIFCSPHIGHO2_02_FULL_51_14]|uniref:Holo-[acyl-carrier-protein] synthase n=1 Tax=Candidatus Magasanikbacteria bacterium RIFCSPHIGHO2_02_FULL_51_14 TaxID=1798683 RepID=A0A1F6MD02_9BACT|nr:MAG: holo-[acyl-carrier-protein] synthase [Candidatus Magasanikbacteria bacterium RIFCSPHIGHO2_02_FULL_51_14]